MGGGGSIAGHPAVGGAGSSTGGGGGRPDDEPSGTSLLTFVNGVVDAPNVALCWARVAEDSTVTPFGELGEAPLEYGQSLPLTEIAGADFAKDTLEPFLIAGELDLIAGLDCAGAIALAQTEEASVAPSPTPGAGEGGAAGNASVGEGGSTASGGDSAQSDGGENGEGGAGGSAGAVRSRLRARGLPAIPAGTLNLGRSLLLAAEGCMGGGTYDGTNAALYCGTGYSVQQPTLSAVLVSLSRVVAFDHVGLQVVHASLGNGDIELRSLPPFPSQDTGFAIASGVTQGQVAPHPATVVNTADDLGVASLHRLEALGQPSTAFSQGWASSLANGGLDTLNGSSTYAIVLSGPRLDMKAVPELWNAPVLTVVSVEPPPSVK